MHIVYKSTPRELEREKELFFSFVPHKHLKKKRATTICRSTHRVWRMNAFDLWVETHFNFGHSNECSFSFGSDSKRMCYFFVVSALAKTTNFEINSNPISSWIHWLNFSFSIYIYIRCLFALTTIMNPVLIYCNIIGVEQNGSFVIDTPRLAKTVL